jgi:polyhydroxyalkanoate synthesis regulator phasin
MSKEQKPSALAEAAIALDHELRRYDELSETAVRMKLNTEKNVERATEALARAAESQDRIHADVQALVAAVAATREKQEADAEALIARAHEIAARRGQFSELVQRMAGLGKMAKEVQELLKSGVPAFDEVDRRMEAVAQGALEIEEAAAQKQMEDLQRQAESLRAQVVSARNKLALLKKPRGQA